MNVRALRGVALATLVFLLVQLGALALVGPFDAAGYQAVEDPGDPTNSLLYLGAILVATGLMLAAFKYDFERAVRGVVVFSSALIAWYVWSVVVPAWVPARGLVAVGLSVGVGAALLVHPEWYVIDAAGVLMGAGAAGLFGISFGILPAILLLVALAVYDAISVYGTRHMLDLAEGVMDLHVPVVLVIPVTSPYSLLDDDFAGANEVFEGDEVDGEVEAKAVGGEADGASASGAPEPAADGDGTAGDETGRPAPEDGERDALFIGLGDAVMPTVMVASAAFFSPAPPLGVGLVPALNLPALGAAVGTLAGLGVLLRMVLAGRAHAGLPLLNGGAVGGYLLGSLAAGVPFVRAVGLAAYV
ncbi:MAG: presenilin family intramembrane aspartyl protease PSH [Haloferacaceae archaeon]